MRAGETVCCQEICLSVHFGWRTGLICTGEGSGSLEHSALPSAHSAPNITYHPCGILLFSSKRKTPCPCQEAPKTQEDGLSLSLFLEEEKKRKLMRRKKEERASPAFPSTPDTSTTCYRIILWNYPNSSLPPRPLEMPGPF